MLMKGHKNIIRRDFLSERKQCSRAKTGRGPIKVRVICRSAAAANGGSRCSGGTDGSSEPSDVAPVVRKSSRVRTMNMKENIYPNVCKTNRRPPYYSVGKCPSEVIKEATELKRKKDDAEALLVLKTTRAQAIEAMYRARAELAKANEKVEEAAHQEMAAVKLDKAIQEKQAVLATLEKSISESQAVLEERKDQVRSQKELIRYYEKRNDCTSMANVVDFARLIEGSLCVMKRKHNSTKAKMLVDAIFNGNLLNGAVAAMVKERMRDYIRQLFRPWRIVKSGDVAAVGAFKSSTINALRDVIDEKEEDLFPSVSTVSRVRSMLDRYGSEVIGWRKENTKYGEVFYLHFEKALRHLLRACQLHDLAEKSSVKIALTVDGADLFKGRTHVSTGVKITDERGVHPITKKPLGVTNVDDNAIEFIKVQSQELCCIMIIADALDSRHLYEDVLKEFYDWGDEIRRNGLPASEFGPKLQPFTVLYNNDLKGTWYLCNKGGGCKNKTHFCHLCPCTRHSLTSYNIGDNRCDRCKHRGRTKCYHHDVCDTVNVANLLHDLELQLGAYYERHGKHFHDISKRSKLLTDHMHANRETDKMHIDYVVPPGDNDKKREYANFIARECILRGIRIDVSDNFEDWRAALRLSVAMEKYVAFLENLKKWHEDGRETVPLVEILELLIPCILHLENRVGEKIISCIVKKGLDLYDSGPKEEFLSNLSRTFQTKVFGTEASPSQWKLRYSSEGGSISLDPIQLRNNNVRSCLHSIDAIVEASILNDASLASKIIQATSKYNEAMVLLTKHSELSDDEIEKFQTLIDDFFELWIEVFGSHGVTNYIHMLAAGHVHYFLKKYRCLYLYSQQGWEALNGKIQTFIHQSSQRGGHNSGTNKGEKSYIYSVVRMVIRDLLWKTYEADLFYLNLERKGIKC